MKHFATLMLGFGIVLAALPTARAADTTCPPNPSPGSTVNGNLIVPTGQGCDLSGVTVTGNVQVQPNASTLSMDASKVEGNVTLGSGTEFVLLEMGRGTRPRESAATSRLITAGLGH